MLDLPVRAGVCHGGPIDVDVVFIVESEKLLPSELHAVVHDNGVWDSKAMDDVKEEQHGLLGLNCGDRSSFYPLCKLFYGDKKVRIALGRPLERSNQIEPLDHEQPCDGDRLECLGWQMGLLSIVLTPFVGVHNLFSIGYDLVSLFGLDHDVFHVGLNGLPDEIPKTLEHAVLVRSPMFFRLNGIMA